MSLRIATALAATLMLASAQARTLSVSVIGGATYLYPEATLNEMPVASGQTITIGNQTFTIADIAEINITEAAAPAQNTVEITYSGQEANVNVPGELAPYVTATISGAHVVIDQSATVADEITYLLSGNSTNGSFTLNGSFKSTLQLCGLTLTNTDGGAALSIQNGKRIKLSAKSETTNTLADSPSGSQKGCIDCKGHLELQGNGTLNVCGNAAHAIFAKEYVEIKNVSINVTGSVKDGLNCNQYLLMQSGSLTLANIGDDGVQVSFKDDANREDIDTGAATIAGGTITATVTAPAAKAIKADGNITVSAGTLTLAANGNARYDTAEASAKSAAALSADGDIVISGGTLTLSATGSGGKGIKGDATFTQSGGDIVISTSGGLFAYSGGQENHNYTGSTDRISSALKSSPKGVKVDGNISITDGTIHVTTTGNGAEGIESKSTLTISGGDVFVKAYDDAINSASHMYIDGGNITVIATANDGLDSNGNMYLRGGYIMAFGAGAPECGIDANEESGYKVYLTGGTILAIGGNNSVPTTSGTRQAYATSNSSVSASQQVTLKNSAGEVMATFTIPTEYSGSSSGGFHAPARLMPPPPPPASMPLMAGPGGPGGPGGWGGPGGSQGGGLLISAPGMTSGQSYTLTIGTSSSSLTAK